MIYIMAVDNIQAIYKVWNIASEMQSFMINFASFFDKNTTEIVVPYIMIPIRRNS